MDHRVCLFGICRDRRLFSCQWQRRRSLEMADGTDDTLADLARGFWLLCYPSCETHADGSLG